MIDYYDIWINSLDDLMWLLLRHLQRLKTHHLLFACHCEWPVETDPFSLSDGQEPKLSIMAACIIHHQQLTKWNFKFEYENTYLAVPTTISWYTCTLVIVNLILCHTSWVVRTGTAGTRSLFTSHKTTMSFESIISIRGFPTISIVIYFDSNVSRLAFAYVSPIWLSGYI